MDSMLNDYLTKAENYIEYMVGGPEVVGCLVSEMNTEDVARMMSRVTTVCYVAGKSPRFAALVILGALILKANQIEFAKLQTSDTVN